MHAPTLDDYDRLTFHIELLTAELKKGIKNSLSVLLIERHCSRLEQEGLLEILAGHEKNMIETGTFDAGVFEMQIAEVTPLKPEDMRSLILALYAEKKYLNIVYDYARQMPCRDFNEINKYGQS